jgi:hypothetical protein
MNTQLESDFCNEPMPKGMSAGYGTFGGFRAVCDNCDYVNVYYECACELAHECKGAN